MVKIGGRTAWRVSDRLFKDARTKNKKGQDIGIETKGRDISQKTIKGFICDLLCDTQCTLREDILREIIKKNPDFTDTKIRESLTDIATNTDLLYGGTCSCECEDIKILLPKLMSE